MFQTQTVDRDTLGLLKDLMATAVKKYLARNRI